MSLLCLSVEVLEKACKLYLLDGMSNEELLKDITRVVGEIEADDIRKRTKKKPEVP